MDKTLYVITVISNPARYRSRYRLYEEFKDYVNSFDGVQLITVEHAFSDREFEITTKEDPWAIQVRGSTELWVKESLMTIGLRLVPDDAFAVAWIDADVSFSRRDWVKETVELLKHYDMIQMFSHAVDLNHDQSPMHTFDGFVYKYLKDKNKNILPEYEQFGHPGYAYAARKDFLDKVGFIDFVITGGSDRHMVMSMFGRVEETIPDEVALACPRLVEKLLRYQSQCLLYGTMNIGYMPGTLFHYYHGDKRKRYYNERVRILIEEEFNPDEDLFYNKYGVIELRGNKPSLRDKMRDYFRSRNEDHNP